jgi:hypothetical protein
MMELKVVEVRIVLDTYRLWESYTPLPYLVPRPLTPVDAHIMYGAKAQLHPSIQKDHMNPS